MNPSAARHPVRDDVEEFLRSARFVQALTLAIVGCGYLAFAAKSTIGWAGMIAAVAVLVLLAGLSLVAQRRTLEWQGLLPISLLVFIGWSALSIFWSDYQWATLGSLAYQFAFAFLGVFVGVSRDLIQVVRAFGDVLRVVLGLSFALEVLSGVLIDMPVAFLQIAGNLAIGGPVQGVLGTRNQLGLVALIALVTFLVEMRTRSVTMTTAVASLSLGLVTAILSKSPVTLFVFMLTVVAALALAGLRRADTERRRIGQIVLVASIVVAVTIGLVARGRIVALLNAGSEFEFRASLWSELRSLVSLNSLEGFGWVGFWRQELLPFSIIDQFGPPHASAANAFIDVWFQLGLVGLFLFIGLTALAMVRSWLVASNRRSVIFVWPALTLVVLLLTSAAESSILVEFGWLTFVICGVEASRNLSWRSRLPRDEHHQD